jgi:hypothetical protein
LSEKSTNFNWWKFAISEIIPSKVDWFGFFAHAPGNIFFGMIEIGTLDLGFEWSNVVLDYIWDDMH